MMAQQFHSIFAARLILVFVAALCVEGVDVHRSRDSTRSRGAGRLVRSEPPPPVRDAALSVNAKGEVALATA